MHDKKQLFKIYFDTQRMNKQGRRTLNLLNNKERNKPKEKNRGKKSNTKRKKNLKK